eukprot:CAMPEP_0115641660 /NCGR_PEP_ID=MMETSP0272-20121206/36428_1 /TAXON_ID=71861 /ORGANISM="Scrippsiella trochoidea, Strain CCMP3099" /LENGTH=260 /DNA_ID=CAMNT_0003078961 /DNA_START=471 /DNA_END=1251 /DNA_ORIENTATION=-
MWRQSTKLMEDEMQRLLWTCKQASKASFATTATTSVSFFANLCSVIKPLREFGVFMGLCVVMVWAMLSLVLIPLFLSRPAAAGAAAAHAPLPLQLLRRLLQEEAEPAAQAGQVEALALRVYVQGLYRARRCCFAMWIIIAITALVWAVAWVQVDTDIPDVIPAGHNQDGLKKAASSFLSFKEAFYFGYRVSPLTADVCSPFASSSSSSGPAACALHWCEIDRREEANTTCRCLRGAETSGCGAATQANVVLRLVSPSPVT